jgi:hypothetical protein
MKINGAIKNEQWRDSCKTGHKTQNEDDKKRNTIQRMNNTNHIKNRRIDQVVANGKHYFLFLRRN